MVRPAGYRPDIDALRAIAVGVILLFHFRIPPFTGGFVGVDIFFVISGYLITRIIHQELQAGRFSFATFYARRVRRIAPAMVAMVILSVVIASVLMLPQDFISFAWSAVAALGMVSNIYFWRQSGYFDTASEMKPMLHSWSLSVEEQVYLFLPLIMWLCAHLLRGRAYLVLLVLGAISLGLAMYGIAASKHGTVFFMMPTRFWEFVMGALVALLPPRRLPSVTVATLAAIGGLAMIFWSAIAYDGSMPFPGLAAVPPTLGTAMVIWAGQQPCHRLMPVLSLRPLLFIGGISYSLYLWHWPILTFFQYYHVSPLGIVARVALLLLSVAVATASWKWIETPFRHGSGRVALGLGGVGAAIVATLLAIQVVPGLYRFSPAVIRMNASADRMWKCPLTDYQPFGSYYACPVTPGSSVSNADLVLWGDSHSQMVVPAVRKVLEEGGRKGIVVPVNGCAPTVTANRTSQCARTNAENIRRIAALPNVRTVVLSLYWQNYREGLVDADDQPARESFFAALTRTIDTLHAAGKEVVVVGPTAVPQYDVASEWSRAVAFNQHLDRKKQISKADFDRDMAITMQFLNRLDQRPDVTVLQPSTILCHDGSCPFIVDGQALHSDLTHLSTDSALRLAPIFRPALLQHPHAE